MIKGVTYSIKQAFKQIFRNKGMSVASVFSITAMMLILALFLFLTVNLNFITENVKDQFGTIAVFLLDDTTREQADDLITDVYKMNGVKSVVYVSREEAIEELKESWGRNAYLLDSLAENTLPNSLRIDLVDIEAGDMIATYLISLPGVEDVRFYRDEINKVINISNVVQRGALIVIGFLVVISVLVVSNTIKLTVMARQEEITIMKFIGATNWFIRGPLFFEGILIGVISAALSVGVSSYIYIRIFDSMGKQAFELFASQLVEPEFLIVNIVWIFLALGIGIGTCGSIVSMRRYLKA